VSVLYVACVVCLLVAIVKIVAVIRPRQVSPADAGSALFFRSVAGTELAHFRQMIRGIGYETVLDERTCQAYHTAVIARQKYDELNAAITWMLGGGLVGVVFGLALLVSSRLL
jgi:hypothetical protein